MVERQKVCFVIMGFGKKTDYESGRLLDLDATYEEIIRPSVTACGYRCIRANEILHSGVIDVRMYEMLLRADLVVADISTGNVNAVYELGVRHALRPFSTIVMKEEEGKLHFDLDHTATFMYRHLGEDIGSSEARRARAALESLINNITSNPTPDSPVYTFIPSLNQPVITDKQFEEIITDAEENQEKFSTLLNEAERAADESNHLEAARNFEILTEMRPQDPYLRQQFALHTYKSQSPSVLLALIEAEKILLPLTPEKSNDPETLGLSGAIYKRLWWIGEDLATLNKAIVFYEKGYELRGDYYTGENAATCLEVRSKYQVDQNEVLYDQMSARKIRQNIVDDLTNVVNDTSFNERSDQLWVYATLANCFRYLDNAEQARKYEELFLSLKPTDWQLDTYNETKSRHQQEQSKKG